MTTERSVFIGIVILVLAIIVACYLLLAFAGSHEEELEESDHQGNAIKESFRRTRKAQEHLNEELVRFMGEEDRATGRKPLVERLEERRVQD